MSKRYTLTVYVAAPGTPLINDDGSPLMLNGKQEHSLVGHLYYKISDETEQGTVGYGFAPLIEGKAFGEGKVKNDEFKKYHNPAYERTIEISEEQYKKLFAYGEHPEVGSFDHKHYNGLRNSCIDFVYGALAYAKVYNPTRTISGDDGMDYKLPYQGSIRVGPNMDEFDKIPNQRGYENSELNTPPDRRRREDPSCFKAFGWSWETPVCSWVENESVQPSSYAQSAVLVENLPEPAQKIYYASKERLEAFYQANNHPYTEESLNNCALALADEGCAKGMRDAPLFNVKDGKILIGERNPGLITISLDMEKAAAIPAVESMNRVQQTFAQEEQDRQMAQSQSRGISMS
ncbi:MAG: hypothetical protein Q4A84_01150 [Neisseria sp.]|uniref:hypothetical protein n=1 Tax=Neisseria sp. TaxID=192066 RepID=UPI0026DB7E94|nr:hypothetical protein [Neisseria sp.]MDO4640300.1 hypothetical protein [Neisseria sp.]